MLYRKLISSSQLSLIEGKNREKTARIQLFRNKMFKKRNKPTILSVKLKSGLHFDRSETANPPQGAILNFSSDFDVTVF